MLSRSRSTRSAVVNRTRRALTSSMSRDSPFARASAALTARSARSQCSWLARMSASPGAPARTSAMPCSTSRHFACTA